MGILLVRLHTLKPPHISVESIISHFTAKAWQKQRPSSASHKETCKLSLGSSARPFFLVKGCTQIQSRLGSIPGPRWLLSFILDIGGDRVSSHWWKGNLIPLVGGKSHSDMTG